MFTTAQGLTAWKLQVNVLNTITGNNMTNTRFEKYNKNT
jgi:hypothetical protein